MPVDESPLMPLLLVFPGLACAAWSIPALWLLGGWIALSVLIQWGAARAQTLAGLPAPACFDPAGSDSSASFGSSTDSALDQESIHLAFLGDLQRGVLDVCGPLAKQTQAEGVDLLISSGDFVSHGEAPYYGLLLAACERAKLVTPTRVVPGNHDLWPRRSKDDDIGGALFEQRFGPRHWALRTGPVLIVGLDTGADWQMEAQLPWLAETLAAHPQLPWICVSHRAPFHFDLPDTPLRLDLAELVPVLEARPPLLFVSGHMHSYHDQTLNGVRYIVNAHGGDVHGLALRREDFELLHVQLDATGKMEVEPRPYARKRSWAVAWDQLAVRMWSDRRKPLGAFLGWPAGLLLKLLGKYVPIVRYPVERRIPSREVLLARRQAAVNARRDGASEEHAS